MTRVMGRSRGETKETTDNGSPSLCYKYGGGHFARECSTGTPSSSCYKCGGGHFASECSSAKVGKRNRELSTQINYLVENREYLGYKSAPHDQGKIRKRKKISSKKTASAHHEKKTKRWWIIDDVGDFSDRKSSSRSHWSSPKTPPAERRKKSSSASGSSKTKNTHRYSASMFSNFGNDEPRRVYNWWYDIISSLFIHFVSFFLLSSSVYSWSWSVIGVCV
ncbi:Detected protein of unknown function [Hibiscus syriacus]|uniref:CCHC-type domain-containing protein n=1 Tax=Hibiscus syriacus TaxID=106335 RepID=A0A6A2YYM4_HIBSY|nr:Detected protein of unknown function [Hibiscus syriacus]